MKAQSFEYQLRHTIAPVPDPEARVRAKRAAVAEFERIHVDERIQVEKSQSDTAGQTRRNGFLAVLHSLRSSWKAGRAGWMPGNTLLGGMATACMVVVAVSVFWLMPPEQREIDLRVPAVTSSPPSPSESAPRERVQPGPLKLPVEAESSARDVPAVAPGREQKTPSSTLVAGEQSASPAPSAPSASAAPSASSVSPAPPVQLAPPVAPAPRAPASPAPPTASRSPEAQQLVEQVVVTGSRIMRRQLESPSPIVTVNQDIVVRPAESASPEPREAGPSRYRAVSQREGFFRWSSVPPAPPAEGGDQFEHFETNSVKSVADEPVSTFSVDVDTASYSFVRRELNEGALPEGDAVRAEEMINYFDYAWPAPESRDVPFKPTVTVSDSPWGEGKKLIHIGIKGYALPVREQPDVNLVMLLDVSGSMDEPDKLPLARQSMALLLDTLKPTDTVAIVVYAGAAGEVLAPTPVRDKEAILRALGSLRAGGSTAGGAGIKLAYELAAKNFRKNGVNRILLATDGDFNVGITDQNELKGFVQREREKGVHLSVLGFGTGNYRDDFAQTLAQNGNGVAAYIDTLNEARKVLVQESTASLFTIARDVKLQVEFNPETVAEYRLVGYETRALNREDFNNDKVDAGDIGSGHTVTAIYEITPTGSNARLIDNRRYAPRESSLAARRGRTSEYGFLRIRYKLPDGGQSRLLEQPIRVNAGVARALEQDVKFSTAVAGFAQILRGGQYTGSLSFEDVLGQAKGALGKDPYQYRAEFVELVRKAQEVR